MKIIFFVTVFLFTTLVSCTGNEDEVQQIDQVINLYYKDAAGKDLLNTNLDNTFSGIQFLDLNGERDLVSITSFSLRSTEDTINYIDYVDGAVRVLKDSTNPNMKTYQSDFIIQLSRTNSANVITTDQDTVRVEYSWTPQLFQISRFFYNGQEEFRKIAGEPNIITIIK